MDDLKALIDQAVDAALEGDLDALLMAQTLLSELRRRMPTGPAVTR